MSLRDKAWTTKPSPGVVNPFFQPQTVVLLSDAEAAVGEARQQERSKQATDIRRKFGLSYLIDDAPAPTESDRQQEILEWLEDQIGTGWKCTKCNHSEYNTIPFCQECGYDAPLLHQVAFKLHAIG